MTELHEKVRAARRARRPKMTQAAVAEGASISLRAYQMFESGQSRPQGANLQAILAQFPELDQEAADAAVGEATREEWPPDVRVFLDVMGAYLLTMTEAERIDYIHDLTRKIITRPGRVTD